ncbi:hypothetical protein JHK87_042321 [Glycine soja]|nr:hypothetical protein JHK87_042321 [Glycine soja]
MEAGVGGGRVGGACDNEISDGMQCMNHPHNNSNNNPGGICAFCLQDKLRNLLSSSPPLSSSSSPSPSFTPPPPPSVKTDHDHNTRSRLPFLVPKKNNNKKPSSYTNISSSANIIFKRSKSTATPKRNQFLEEKDFSPRKRNGFWSFLYPSSSKEAKSFGPNGKYRGKCLGKKSDHVIIVEEDKCLSSSSSSSSKVSRSRSVGCGSRSFSSDFFERISSGLGDCTLRRVESQREGGKPKLPASANTMNHCMKERVRCGGIFSGFVMNSSSSTTSSSSWVSSSVDDGRGRSWGWAFASPMRAFTTKGSPPSSSSKRDASDKNNATPNLSAIPTLLTVRG